MTRMVVTLRIMCMLAMLALAACGSESPFAGDTDTSLPADHDEDLDGISDTDEGRYDAGGPRDSDSDTIADFEDSDSDNDTIPDMIESGDADVTTPPEDSDADTIPDYLDGDSDANGVLDGDEGSGDMDGDTVADYADPDNDGDSIDDVTEIMGNPAAPIDSDGDTMPDYSDVDSDNDTISDRDERNSDTDEDLIQDYLDLDTDGDTIPDSEEAGDSDITTPPRDTDGDYLPDFKDTDSDADGLSDSWEREHGLDPYDDDSDGDGVPDLIEVGADTDPLDATDNPRSRGNFVFIMYYNDPSDPPDPALDPDPTMDHLVFATDLQKADIYFTLDSSGSMSGEINNLLSSLRTTIVPGVLAEIPNVWFGVGRLEDCSSCAHDMAMLQAETDVVTLVETALTGWTTCGGREPYPQNLYAISTGDLTPFLAWHITPTTWTCTPPGDIGWPCFRPDSLPIVIQFGDESFNESQGSCTPVKTHAEAVTALNSISAKYIGVNSGSTHADMVTIATGTGSVDSTGSPLVFDISSTGTGLGAQVVDAIEILAEQVPIEVTTQMRDDTTDLVDTVAEFIDYIEPSVVGGWPDPTDPSIICVSGLDVADLYAPIDGRNDSFTSVLPGTPVCFDIYVKQNWTVPATDEPQTFLCEIDVVGDGLTVLSTRNVYFLVPPDFYTPIPG